MSSYQSLDTRYPMFPNHRADQRSTAQQKPQVAKPTPKPKVYTYSSIFNKVLLKRLKFYGRLSGILSLVISILLTILSRGSILMIPIKTTLIWVGFIVFRFARDITIKVESSSYQTPFLALIGHVLSSDFLTYLFAFSISSICYYTVVIYQFDSFSYYVTSPTVTIKPFVNDSFIYCWYYVLVSALAYSLKYVLLEKNKVDFQFGVYRLPQDVAIRELDYLLILKNNLIFNGLSVLIAPIAYLFSRSFIYNVILYPFFLITGLNKKIPGVKITLSLYLILFFTNFILTTSWELLNEVYNIFVRIGCISSGKPISEYSADPLYTLLSGLQDIKNPIVRLTAFQELAFLSSSKEINHRKIFYTGTFKNSNVWYTILEECSHVIKSSCRSMTTDLYFKDQGKASIATSLNPLFQKPNEPITKESLFGNSGSANSNIFSNAAFTNENELNYTLKMENKKIEDPLTLLLKNPERLKKEQNGRVNNTSGELGRLLKSIQLPEIIEKMIKSTNPTRERLRLIHNKLATTKYGSFFVGDIKREANRRLINPCNLGNAIITITEILLHAQVEDKNININHTSLTQVLILLTKVYKSSLEFLNNPPVLQHHQQQGQQQDENCISQIHEFSLICFFELVVSYNPVLNDLILPPDVFDLAKWCVNVAIEDQKRKKGIV